MVVWFASIIIALLFVLCKDTNAACQQTCTSDAQCKGFTKVSATKYCVDGCCATYNSLIAKTRIPQSCTGDMQGAPDNSADVYPWLAYIVVYVPGSVCQKCLGVLVSQDWVATDKSCYDVMTQNSVTNIYFYYDDVLQRQIYNYTRLSAGDGITRIKYLQINYIGTDAQIPLTPLPVNCADINPTSADVIYWTQYGLSSRTLTRQTVQLRDKDNCAVVMSQNTNWQLSGIFVLCPDGAADNDFFAANMAWFEGAPLVSEDALGNLEYIGMGMNDIAVAGGADQGNWSLFADVAKAMPSVGTQLGIPCAA